ncbi:Phage minor structural protein GP20, partial [Snodgrassella alvi SCGC AB-598-O02]
MLAIPLGLWLIWAISVVLSILITYLLSRQKLLTERQKAEIHILETENDHVRLKTEAETLQRMFNSYETELIRCRQEIQLLENRLTTSEAINSQLDSVRATLEQTKQQYGLATEQYQQVSAKLAVAEQQLFNWQKRENDWHLQEEAFAQIQHELNNVRVENSRLSTQLQHEREAFEEKLVLL